MKADEPNIAVRLDGSDFSIQKQDKNLFRVKVRFIITDNGIDTYDVRDKLMYFLGEEETTEKEVKSYIDREFFALVRKAQILYNQKYGQNES